MWSDLQLSVLHMMGALLYSSKDNACLATCQDTCLLLLTFLDPREKCTPLQALTVKVYVSMVHVLHNTLPVELQVTVDCGVMLVGFLNILSPRYHEKGLVNPCIKMVITMLGELMQHHMNDDLPCFLSPKHIIVYAQYAYV